MDTFRYTVKSIGTTLGFVFGALLLTLAITFAVVWAANQSILAGWIVSVGIVVIVCLITGTIYAGELWKTRQGG